MMGDDRTEAVTALLVQAMEAHGNYEETELNGVYDQEWARWYAAYAVEHGIGSLIGHEVTADELGRFLASSYDEFRQTEPAPAESWQSYTARRIAEEL
jgi:hypothetical protein